MRGGLKRKCATEVWIRHGEIVATEERRREEKRGKRKSKMTTGEVVIV